MCVFHFFQQNLFSERPDKQYSDDIRIGEGAGRMKAEKLLQEAYIV